jgi:eukaryotic-like serine/threonine-protein kinase
MTAGLTRGLLVAGRYRLERLLGQGGMGFVWAAQHVVTRREVAMKFVRGSLALRPQLRKRLLREARAAAAVGHPNVVEIYDVFELDDETPVLVMELLHGETFGRRLAREVSLSVEDAASLLLPVVSAVGTAHRRGIVHRDLKPENVFLARDGASERVMVLDFGIAKLAEEGSEGPTLTGTGTMLGTPCYMAPEQGFGEPDVDHRADIWSMGAMLYEALTGGRPVEGENLGQVLKRLMTDGVTPIEVLLPDLPADVGSLVMRMLSRERADRPQDIKEVFDVLARYSRSAAHPIDGASSGVVRAPPSTSWPPSDVDPLANTLAGDSPAADAASGTGDLETGGAHSLSIIGRPVRRLKVAGLVLTVALLSLFGWRAFGTRTERVATLPTVVSNTPSSVAPPLAIPPAVARDRPSSTPGRPAEAPVRAARSERVLRSDPAPAVAHRRVVASAAPAAPRAPSAPESSASTSRPPPKPSEGLYEDPPF